MNSNGIPAPHPPGRSARYATWHVLAWCLLFSFQLGRSQPEAMRMADFHEVAIPFELINNFIIVEVRLNNLLSSKFILDTGAEYSILTRHEIPEILGVPYERKVKVYGADMRTELPAYLIRQITLEMGELLLPGMEMLVLEEDLLQLESHIGVEVSGILGGNFLKRYFVKLDFEHKRLTLYHPSREIRTGGYTSLPVEISRNKPYLQASYLEPNDSLRRVRLLLDTGAGIPLLLFRKPEHPEAVRQGAVKAKIGIGLGGFIEGYMGWMESLKIGDQEFRDLLCHYQDTLALFDSLQIVKRDGILGNEVWRRFHVMIDYQRGTLFLKKNRYFKQAFSYDKSGLLLLAVGPALNRFFVAEIIPGSPAHLAGIRKGDEIRRVNGCPSWMSDINGLIRRFKGREGKEFRLVVQREDLRLRKRFHLVAYQQFLR